MTEVIGEATMDLPFGMGLLGSIGGIPVIENDLLDFDEMYISTTENRIVVGEIAHFRWRLQQLATNDRCRSQARENIQKLARRILGESWELSSK